MKYLILLFLLTTHFINANDRHLDEYYEMTNRWEQPWDTLKFAVDQFQKEHVQPGLAMDLGCGAAVDTPYLIKKGWTVIAIDIEQKAESYLRKKVPGHLQSHLLFHCTTYEQFPFADKVHLVNASCALPYCSPIHFNRVMKQVTDAILPGGRFSGHFFGKRDAWAAIPEITFHTKEEVLRFFAGFEIELFEEKEWEGKSGPHVKHWHTYKVVAKKR